MSDAEVLPERTRMHKDDRRSAIIVEAIRIIGERGYQACSINELAKRCGLTTAGLLHHFGSKEGVLIALLKERDRRDADAISGRLGLHRDQDLSREQVLTMLHAIVRQNAGQPHLVRLYAILRAEALVENHPAGAFFLERERATFGLFAAVIEPHVADASATARQLQAAMQGLEVQWLRENCAFDLVAEWDKVADKLLH
ncbi:TetR/AcrR family transcriptional regulator [Novosphingobium sp.]|uniref:TetR/AcrR family transcriptional regulator n=1 Tax=Novosphingobium sp. TaxID=1874826 RepID=UPI0025DB9217|nr:TetR/AcrR family transcriptional regulator [Novosphingobium sp.]